MQMPASEKHVWAEIDLDALRYNFRAAWKARRPGRYFCALSSGRQLRPRCRRVRGLCRRGPRGWRELSGGSPSAAQIRADAAYPHSGPCGSRAVRPSSIQEDINAAFYSLPGKDLSGATPVPPA